MTHHVSALLATTVGTAAICVPGFAGPAAASTVMGATAPPVAAAGHAPAQRGESGRLLVTVRGLPESVASAVVVDGPGQYRAAVSDTVKLRHLRKGAYDVTVRPVGRPNGTYRGRVDDDRVTVRPDSTAHVTVTYRWDADDEPVVRLTAFESEVLRLTNKARSTSQNCGTHGVKPKAPALSIDTRLVTAARKHAADMAAHSYFAHDSRDGRSPGDRMSAAGYRWSWWGENIAAGFDTPRAVVAAWLDSDGHCANLMDRHFTELGVGFARRAGSDYSTYWVQDFGRPR